MGGTSFDTCLISDGRPQMMYEGRVEGLPVQTPWVDVRSIGAGGGSIAYVDRGGLLKVGPRSAGADPGPACYARGGVEPTVTDAAASLGMLGEGHLASGIVLDLAGGASRARNARRAARLQRRACGRGVVRILTATMADAIRNITIERGDDPRRMKLMPFGGAGPLFGVLLARDLGITDVVVPPARRQLLRLGAARRRPHPDCGADPDHEALPQGARRRPGKPGHDVRRATGTRWRG